MVIGKDNDVAIAQKFMNVDPSVWGPDAHIFKPERWAQDELPAAVTEGGNGGGWSYLMTFSTGPRNCIVYRMAVAEFKVGLAVLASQFEFVWHEDMRGGFGEVQIVDRPRFKGRAGYCMPCWVKALDRLKYTFSGTHKEESSPFVSSHIVLDALDRYTVVTILDDRGGRVRFCSCKVGYMYAPNSIDLALITINYLQRFPFYLLCQPMFV